MLRNLLPIGEGGKGVHRHGDPCSMTFRVNPRVLLARVSAARRINDGVTLFALTPFFFFALLLKGQKMEGGIDELEWSFSCRREKKRVLCAEELKTHHEDMRK